MDKVLTAIVALIAELIADNTSPLFFQTAENQPHGCRRVTFGDPQQIGKSDFPCVAVRPVGSRILHEATRTDDYEHTVEIVIIDNLRNYSETSPKDPNKVQSLATMMDMMELSDSDQKVSAGSIVGKLLKNPRLPYQDSGVKHAAIATRLEGVDYVFNTSRGFPTFEVIGTFRVTSKGDRA